MTRVHPRGAAIVAIAALLTALLPQTRAVAAGPIWLPGVQADRPSVDPTYNQLRPVIATDRNTYILSTRARPHLSDDETDVYLSVGVRGAAPGSLTWTTRKISSHGPAYIVSSYGNVSLAVDPRTHRLFAVWRYTKSKVAGDAVGVWTSSDEGSTWSGPTDLSTADYAYPGSIQSVVAGGGTAYIAFTSSKSDVSTGSCDNRPGDYNIFVARYDGRGWSRGQNLTSCLTAAQQPEFVDATLTRDEDGHLYLIATTSGNQLWYADNAGGAWTTPVRIVRDLGDSPPGSGDAAQTLAASKGVVYVAYAGVNGTYPHNYNNIFLISHAPGRGWSVPLNVTRPGEDADVPCEKYAPALVARAGRLGLAYIAGYSSRADCAHDTLRVATGTPGSLTRARTTLAADANCDHPGLATDGDIFRLVADCGYPPGKINTFLYGQQEFLDVVGPTMTSLRVPATTTAPSVPLSWSAHDPTPGSGVASYEVQVKEDGGAWRNVVRGGTRSRSFDYTKARAGHTYTFRVRARDRVNNWGRWVSARTRAM